MKKTHFRPTHVLVAFLEALVITWGFLYLGEYFEWRWVREAGGFVSGAGP